MGKGSEAMLIFSVGCGEVSGDLPGNLTAFDALNSGETGADATSQAGLFAGFRMASVLEPAGWRSRIATPIARPRCAQDSGVRPGIDRGENMPDRLLKNVARRPYAIDEIHPSVLARPMQRVVPTCLVTTPSSL